MEIMLNESFGFHDATSLNSKDSTPDLNFSSIQLVNPNIISVHLNSTLSIHTTSIYRPRINLNCDFFYRRNRKF